QVTVVPPVPEVVVWVDDREVRLQRLLLGQQVPRSFVRHRTPPRTPPTGRAQRTPEEQGAVPPHPARWAEAATRRSAPSTAGSATSSVGWQNSKPASSSAFGATRALASSSSSAACPSSSRSANPGVGMNDG